MVERMTIMDGFMLGLGFMLALGVLWVGGWILLFTVMAKDSAWKGPPRD